MCIRILRFRNDSNSMYNMEYGITLKLKLFMSFNGQKVINVLIFPSVYTHSIAYSNVFFFFLFTLSPNFCQSFVSRKNQSFKRVKINTIMTNIKSLSMTYLVEMIRIDCKVTYKQIHTFFNSYIKLLGTTSCSVCEKSVCMLPVEFVFIGTFLTLFKD